MPAEEVAVFTCKVFQAQELRHKNYRCFSTLIIAIS